MQWRMRVRRATIVSEHLAVSGVFDEVHTISLIAELDNETGEVVGTATRADVLAVLDVLAGEAADPERLKAIGGAGALTRATPDDMVYFSFSGHGLLGNDGIFHMFLTDIGDGMGRQVDERLLRRTLDSDVLARRLRGVDAGDFVMVFDACNAAASVEGGGFKPGPMGSRGLGQLAYDKAMRVLAASQAEEVALESDQLRHGLLTYAMLREGLAGGGGGGGGSGSRAAGSVRQLDRTAGLWCAARAAVVRRYPQRELFSRGAGAHFV